MKVGSTLLSLLAASLLAFPSFAQERNIDINAFAVWANANGNSAIDFADDPNDFNDVEFDSDQGFGISVNVFWSYRFSTEFAGSIIDPDLTVTSTNNRIVLVEPLEMIPVTATLQFHFMPGSRFDPYIGVGAGYVLFEDVEDRNDLDDIDFERIDFDDDVGLVLNAGFRIGFTPNFGIYLDGKYIPVEASADAVFPDGVIIGQQIEINPVILAAGLSFSF